MEKYDQISVVGEGSYGIVMKCRHKETDQIVAVKKFLETEEDATIRKLALREIRMLKRLKHENLVTMIEVFRHRKRFYIVFEYLEGTVLDELEKMPGGLGEERTRERTYQVCRAISYCHHNSIIHRDVKPENVLVSSLGVVKLCDFGFARIVSLNGEACTEYVATRWYRAPELLVGESVYGPPVDVWAIGCLFAEMLTGDPLFPGESDVDQLFLIIRMLGKPCSKHQFIMSRNAQLRAIVRTPSQDHLGYFKVFQTWPLVTIDFLNSCTRMDPNERATAEELLRHPYFTHDKFPQRFLPALREKVNTEFNAPLLRKLKSEVLLSTDRRDEINKHRRSLNESKWKYSLTEGTPKRKLSCDTVVTDHSGEKNRISLSKSSQRLSILNSTNRSGQQVSSRQKIIHQSKTMITSHSKQQLKLPSSNNNIQTLENLVKTNKFANENRPLSDHRKDEGARFLPTTPTYHTFHFGLGDVPSKSPSFQNGGGVLLHPSIHNISFNREPSKQPPVTNHNVHRTSHAPSPVTSRIHLLKKLERNAAETVFGQGDYPGIGGAAATPRWLTGFGGSSRKRDTTTKGKVEEFSLPNLPGAISPNKTKKKNSIPEIHESRDVSPRLSSATSSPTIQNSNFT